MIGEGGFHIDSLSSIYYAPCGAGRSMLRPYRTPEPHHSVAKGGPKGGRPVVEERRGEGKRKRC